METLDPQGRASLDPMGLIGSNYVGDHYIAMATRVPIQSAQKPYAAFPRA